MAFFIATIYQALPITSLLSNSIFYLGYGFIYCKLYDRLHKTKANTYSLISCILIILFDIGMTIDAEVYKGSKTFIWVYYDFFACTLRINFIVSFIAPRRVLRFFSESFTSVCNFLYNRWPHTAMYYGNGKTQRKGKKK